MTKCKSIKIQTLNTNCQSINVMKDKCNKIQMEQDTNRNKYKSTKRQNTNGEKHKMTKYNLDIIQSNKIQMKQNNKIQMKPNTNSYIGSYKIQT